MKIRSKALYKFLLDADVLNGPQEAVMRAKAEYRKFYKRQWKRRARPVKEIRFTVTLKELHDIKMQARAVSLRHTTYAKQATLARAGLPAMPDEALLDILQLVSMAVIALGGRNASVPIAANQLMKAEAKLLEYLKPTKQHLYEKVSQVT